MYRVTAFVAAIIIVLFSAGTALAGVIAKVDLSTQRMHVYVDGELYYTWPVSTARRGYRTPTGTYRVQSMKRYHRSRRYHNSPMPHSIFFYHGYAIHGSYATRRLGRRASHGCIRLHPSNARELYGLVKDYGPRNTRIIIRR
ncbi:MAG: L,D-transpeptidase [Alphaproteobacteria bacterium]